MKNKHLYILTFLLFFTAVYSHAQITEAQLLERFENPLFDPSVEEPVTASSLILDDDDLLLATRSDIYDNNAWLGQDSVEFYHNSEGQLIEDITLRFEMDEWNNFTRRVHEYNDDDTPMYILDYEWNGTAWDTSGLASYEYDGNQNVTKVRFQSWGGTAWVNGSQFLFTYNMDDFLDTLTFQFWGGSAWDNFYRNISEYDISGNLTSETTQTFAVDWENSSKTVLEYDGDGNRTIFRTQDWFMNDWLNSFQFVYGFDQNNNEISQLKQDWYNGDWEDGYRITNTYNVDNDLTLTLREDWNGINWINNFQDIYEYIPSAITIITSQYWDGTDWINEFRFDEFNDQFENIIYTNNLEWDGSDWVNTDQMFFYYEIIISNKDLEKQSADLQVFPNPSNGILMLDLSELEIRNTNLRIYNTLGQLQHFQSVMDGTEKFQLILPQLGNGIFQLQVESNNQLFTKAIQIIK